MSERQIQSDSQPQIRGLGRQKRNRMEGGFTALEITVVAAIGLIVAGMSVVKLDTAVKQIRLRSSTSEIAGLFQMARIQAVRDNKFYQVVLPAAGATTQTAFVDINADTTADAGDPLVQLGSNNSVYTGSITPPSPPALTTMSLDSTFTPQAQSGGSATNPWFNNRGLPCVPDSTTSPTVCTTSVGTVGYVVYIQDAFGNWGAVTILPSGRIKGWTWNGSAWN